VVAVYVRDVRPYANIAATTIDLALRYNFATCVIQAGFSQRMKRRQQHYLAWSRHSCRFNRIYGESVCSVLCRAKD